MHESLDEFQFRLDTTTDSRVIFPWVSEKSMYNVVNTLAPSFLIGSSLFLQVRRTTIISWTSSNFSQIIIIIIILMTLFIEEAQLEYSNLP